MPTSDEKLDKLLQDLRELANYLHERGGKTRLLSSQFAEHAKEKSSDREFDLNQSRMLDYQHSLWHDIGNLVEKLIKKHE
ncbi:MAG TPA: hypothetical protein VNE38_09395 [Ktedonobacteraceae bacterium]|nr:hypothetical protein [Ktedonobacteraceae bacterium]